MKAILECPFLNAQRSGNICSERIIEIDTDLQKSEIIEDLADAFVKSLQSGQINGNEVGKDRFDGSINDGSSSCNDCINGLNDMEVAMGEAGQKVECYRIDNEFDFDNIGFMKPQYLADNRQSNNKTQIRILTCAACDQGPLGFQLLVPDIQSWPIFLYKNRCHTRNR